MAKDTFYFTHDYGARNDPKLQRLQMKLGMEGIGLYWCLIELSYEQEGVLNSSDIETYAFNMRVQCERIIDVLQNFNLFILDAENDCYYSQSVISRLTIRNEKSKSASKSANARWEKYRLENANASKNNTNASKNDAIKERKGKEKKESKLNLVPKGFFLNEFDKDYQLSEIEVGKVIQFIKLKTQKDLTGAEILDQWTAFKIDNFDKREWKNSIEDVISHFRNSLKIQMQKNATDKSTITGGGKQKLGTSDARIEAARNW